MGSLRVRVLLPVTIAARANVAVSLDCNASRRTSGGEVAGQVAPWDNPILVTLQSTELHGLAGCLMWLTVYPHLHRKHLPATVISFLATTSKMVKFHSGMVKAHQ